MNEACLGDVLDFSVLDDDTSLIDLPTMH